MKRQILEVAAIASKPLRFASFLIAALLAGCASAAGSGAAEPKPGPMPPRTQWQGLYQGPYHIQLRIVTHGNEASGTWSAVGDREGEFTGTVSGNLLVMDWSEHGRGNSDSWSGRGYFLYNVDRARGIEEILGQWGIGTRGTSNAWWAIKRTSSVTTAGAGRDGDDRDDRDDNQNCGVDCDTQDTDRE